ncbi:MAG: hypothetical protein ICV81_14670 [Flavisolibacter sp.]|nr:hypothetical protein [Flavisolibacter sp.]
MLLYWDVVIESFTAFMCWEPAVKRATVKEQIAGEHIYSFSTYRNNEIVLIVTSLDELQRHIEEVLRKSTVRKRLPSMPVYIPFNDIPPR